jgi:branched-chain amino acid transport system ATP-binding protein
MALLEVQKMSKHFGGLRALSGVDLSIEPGQIYSIIGPNGAGKTTLLNVVSGFFPPTEGKVVFKGSNLTKRKIHQRVGLGVARTFQGSVLLREKTVLENIIIGCHQQTRESFWGSFLGLSSARQAESDNRERASELARSMGLAGWEDKFARELPHGLQRILGLCIALATRPSLLLLDEPVTGMNATEITVMMNLIRKIRDDGVTIVLVEHNMKAVMGLSDRITVLSYGEKIAEGSPEEIRADRHVIEAYLGSEV